MENASKALLIAGGIFLGIITLSILVVLMNNISNIGASHEEKKKAQELAAWNAEWEAYNKSYLYGAEVLTVSNKAKQNNLEHKDNSTYHVSIIINLDPKIIGGAYVLPEQAEYELSLRKTEAFKCVGISYSNETGRVCEMEFEIEI